MTYKLQEILKEYTHRLKQPTKGNKLELILSGLVALVFGCESANQTVNNVKLVEQPQAQPEIKQGAEFYKGFYKGRLKDGGYYEGDIRNGLLDGKGLLISAEGNKYEGEFRQGKMDGKGQLTLTDGSFYKGEFRGGKLFDGEMRGKIIDPDLKGFINWVYEGNIEQNLFQGDAKITVNEKLRYEGKFVDNMPVGEWKAIVRGQVFTGRFIRNDKATPYNFVADDAHNYANALKDSGIVLQNDITEKKKEEDKPKITIEEEIICSTYSFLTKDQAKLLSSLRLQYPKQQDINIMQINAEQMKLNALQRERLARFELEGEAQRICRKYQFLTLEQAERFSLLRKKYPGMLDVEIIGRYIELNFHQLKQMEQFGK